MRRATELNVFFILISSLFHLIITKSTLQNVTNNQEEGEEGSTFKSQMNFDDDYKAGQKLGNVSRANYSESDSYDETTISSWFQVNESDSGDNQTWSASYDGETELANYTQNDYSLSNRTTEEVQPKFSTIGRNRWEESESDTSEANQWGVSGTISWDDQVSSATEETQPNFSGTGKNQWEELESDTSESNQWGVSGTISWDDQVSSATEETQTNFSATGRNRWEEPESNTTGGSLWEEIEFNTTERNRWEELESDTSESDQWGMSGTISWEEQISSTTEGTQPNVSATGRNRWEELEFNTTGRNRWEEKEFNTTEEAQQKFNTTERNRWEELEFDNQTDGSNYTEWGTKELWTPEEEPTTPRPPLLYRNYGYVNETKDGWLVTIYDESDTPCLKMNLQIVINVYFARNDPRSSLKAASFIQTFPTSSDDLTVEGECNNDTSTVLISWETSNLTWHFDQGENGFWSLREVELSITNPEWFEKYNFCGNPPFVDRIGNSPCHPFSLKSGKGSWYDSGTRCRQVNVPLIEKGTTPLKAVVFLMDSFRVEPFARNGTDFETRVC